MQSTSRESSVPGGRKLAIALGIYGLLMPLACGAIAKSLGAGYGFGAGAILSFPLLVGLRVCNQPSTILRRDLAYLSILPVASSAGVALIVWRAYDLGLDQRHAEQVLAARFLSVLHQDPAFQQVEIVHGPKAGHYLQGVVPSYADHQRLVQRLPESPIELQMSVAIARPTRRTNDQRD